MSRYNESPQGRDCQKQDFSAAYKPFYKNIEITGDTREELS